ncbi:MAG: hypothetical protein DRI01_03530 [Chloroflexi bacterium]|nr:MAG: hypothetical protein DRI01_03530 [Chloroflexota bacterium]
MQELIEDTIEKMKDPVTNDENVFNKQAERIAIVAIRNFSGNLLRAGLGVAYAVAEFGNSLYGCKTESNTS